MLLDALHAARKNLAETLGIVVQGQQKFGILFEEHLKYRGLEWTLSSTHNLPMLDPWPESVPQESLTQLRLGGVLQFLLEAGRRQ